MVAQAITGTPGHINSMALAVPHVLRALPPATLVPGDVLATNDPWLNSGHLNDITVVTPVFHRGRLVGYTASTCHAMDIGGRGITVDALDCYEEGLLLPPCRLYAAGQPQQVLELLAANVRAPEAVLGDIHAQVSGNAVGAPPARRDAGGVRPRRHRGGVGGDPRPQRGRHARGHRARSPTASTAARCGSTASRSRSSSRRA